MDCNRDESLKCVQKVLQALKESDIVKAKKYFEKVTKLDPGYGNKGNQTKIRIKISQ